MIIIVLIFSIFVEKKGEKTQDLYSNQMSNYRVRKCQSADLIENNQGNENNLIDLSIKDPTVLSYTSRYLKIMI